MIFLFLKLFQETIKFNGKSIFVDLKNVFIENILDSEFLNYFWKKLNLRNIGFYAQVIMK